LLDKKEKIDLFPFYIGLTTLELNHPLETVVLCRMYPHRL
jgi:hypothetical protein